jgi:hypothetical protein
MQWLWRAVVNVESIYSGHYPCATGKPNCEAIDESQRPTTINNPLQLLFIAKSNCRSECDHGRNKKAEKSAG